MITRFLALAIVLTAAAVPLATAAGEAPAPPAAGATLTVTFQHIATPSGSVMVALVDSPEAYASKAPPVGSSRIVVGATTAEITFSGLKPGTYAIRSFHDLNGDGKINTNPFGIPIEPYAFSNNARGGMGPPSWGAAAFAVKAGDNRQTIDIE
jgi:uncharacterized protein (DUF2141 family)